MFLRSLVDVRKVKAGVKALSRFQNQCSSAVTSRSLSSSFQLGHGGSSYPTGLVAKEEEKYVVRFGFIKTLHALQNRYSRSPYTTVKIPEVNVADFVWTHVSSYPNTTALVCGMTGRQYTYQMARQMSQKFGSSLRRLGASKGDVVALILPNIPEFPIGTYSSKLWLFPIYTLLAFLGCVGVGLTVTTMNPTYRAEEISRQLDDSGAKYILTIGMFLQNTKQAVANLSSTKIEEIIVLGKTRNL